MNNWKEYKLKDFAEIVKEGYNPNGDKNINYIGLEHIEQEKLRLLSVGKSSDVTSNKFKFSANDILFGKLRPYFRKVVKPQFDGICSTDIWVFRAKKNFDQNFLYYFLANWEFVNTANTADSGTRMPRADWNFLKDTEWLLPSLSEQTAIASILSSLDNKIDLLHRQNKTLEELAETLFNYLLSNDSKDSKIGKLSDEFDFTMGQSPPGESYNESRDGMVFFQGRTDFGFRFPEPRLYTTDPKRLAKKYETLISVRAPVGDMNIAFEDCCIGRGLSSFRYKKVPKLFSYTFYKLKYLKDEISQFEDNGTVFGSISKDDFSRIDLLIPSFEIAEKIDRIISPLDKKIFANHIQIQILQKLRDSLLPKLMSGEVRVKL
jgi:type I restriction enzyme, S subunit